MKKLLILSLTYMLFSCTSTTDYYSDYSSNSKVILEDRSSQLRMPAQQNSKTIRVQDLDRLENKPYETKRRREKLFNKSKFPPTRIALLAPLSGKFAKIGKSLVDSANLAIFKYNEPNLILLPIDTKGTVNGAIEAFNQAREEKVKLVLGPLFGRSAKELGDLSLESGISVISFSNDSSIADSGVFSIGHRPDQQIERVMKYAKSIDIEDVLSFLPNSYYGNTISEKIKKIANETPSLAIVRTEIYRKDRAGNPIKPELHLNALHQNLLNARSPNSYDSKTKRFNNKPIKFPRGLLIIEDDEVINSIEKYYKDKMPLDDPNKDEYVESKGEEPVIFDRKKVQLLGTDKWYQDNIIKNPFMEGAIFASANKERFTRFESDFLNSHGYKPTKVSSLAYDLVSLSIAIARFTNGKDFSRNIIMNPRGFIGIDGIFRFKENGLSERGLAVFRIQNASVKIVSKSPEYFN